MTHLYLRTSIVKLSHTVSNLIWWDEGTHRVQYSENLEAQIKLEDVAPVRRDVTRLLTIIAHSFPPEDLNFHTQNINHEKTKRIKGRKKEDIKKEKWLKPESSYGQVAALTNNTRVFFSYKIKVALFMLRLAKLFYYFILWTWSPSRADLEQCRFISNWQCLLGSATSYNTSG